jgi:hypothetical protein
LKHGIKNTNRTKITKISRTGLVMIALLMVSISLPVMNPIPETSQNVLSQTHDFLPSAETPDLNLTYTTRTLFVDTPVQSGDTIAGDHVTLKAEWSPSLVNSSRLEVHAPAIPSTLVIEDNETTLEIDTRALGNNATCTITSTAYLTNGSVMVLEFMDVYIGNYFSPKVTVTSPNGGEVWTGIHNITWSASDMNIDDTLLFDVLVSSDSSQSYETLITSTNLTWFEWNTSALTQMESYIVQIRVTDGIYFFSDYSDDLFTAGTILPTSTTTPTTPTTPNGLEPRIIAFVAILLISSGIMALVVYYAARKWF